MTVEETRNVAHAAPDGALRYAQFALHRARATLRVWHERYRYRQRLAKRSERELRDVGLSSASVEYEVAKPFWRA